MPPDLQLMSSFCIDRCMLYWIVYIFISLGNQSVVHSAFGRYVRRESLSPSNASLDGSVPSVTIYLKRNTLLENRYKQAESLSHEMLPSRVRLHTESVTESPRSIEIVDRYPKKGKKKQKYDEVRAKGSDEIKTHIEIKTDSDNTCSCCVIL